MYIISKYKNVKSPKIEAIISINEYLKIIKNGDDNLPIIKLARKHGKGTQQYNTIKIESLPTFRFNFLFKNSASNNNIIEPTGFIYLDVDNDIEIPDSDYIFACWKSLSNEGHGLLVKVHNLTLVNFKDIYNELSKLIGIDSDIGARKATQQTVQSYDVALYHNSDSKVFQYEEIDKVSPPNKLEKKKKGIVTSDTFLEEQSYEKIRFNNIDDYFDSDEKTYIVFKEKIWICNPFIPKRVKEGERNLTLFIYFSQLFCLNPNMHRNYLKALASGINTKMRPKLSKNEINGIIDNVYKRRKDNTLNMYFNQERRILFNPSKKIRHKDKMKIVNKELGILAQEIATEIIYSIIEDWNFKLDGKILQTKVAQLTGFSLSKVKRYWHHFKDYISDLNNENKVESNISAGKIKRLKPSIKQVRGDNDMSIDCSVQRLLYINESWAKSA